jgi:hypothetical protein
MVLMANILIKNFDLTFDQVPFIKKYWREFTFFNMVKEKIIAHRSFFLLLFLSFSLPIWISHRYIELNIFLSLLSAFFICFLIFILLLRSLLSWKKILISYDVINVLLIFLTSNSERDFKIQLVEKNINRGLLEMLLHKRDDDIFGFDLLLEICELKKQLPINNIIQLFEIFLNRFYEKLHSDIFKSFLKIDLIFILILLGGKIVKIF